MLWGTVIEFIPLTHNTVKSYVKDCGNSCCCATVFRLQVFFHHIWFWINYWLTIWSHHNVIRKVIIFRKKFSCWKFALSRDWDLNMISYFIIHSLPLLIENRLFRHLTKNSYTSFSKIHYSWNKIFRFFFKNMSYNCYIKCCKEICLDIINYMSFKEGH